MTISLASILARALASATPIALGGVGGLFGERSGIVNIGLEGTMLFSAFSAALGSYFTGSPWIGLLSGMFTGMLIAFIHAFLCISIKVQHVIIGLVINIFSASMSVYLLDLFFDNKGSSAVVNKLPVLSIPILRDIPGISEAFSNMSIITLLAIIITLIAQFVLYKTKFGLHVMATGENNKAAFSMGVNVERTQYIAVVIGGLCCGLAGSFLSISYLNMFTRGMVSGRGFIAIAAMLFGRFSPTGVLFASLFFGLADALQMALQGNVNLPKELVQSIPYVLTIIGVSLNEYKQYRKSTAY